MPRFKSKCPFCSNNDWKNWYHTGCSSSKGEDIDIEGYITCNDCNKKMDLLDMNFYCDTHSKNMSFTRKIQLRSLICLLDNIDDDFLDILEENLLKRWDKTH